MGIAKYIRGQHMVIDGEVYELDRKINANDWQITSKATGQRKIFTRKEFANLYVNGSLRFVHYDYEPANDPVLNKKLGKESLAIDMLPEKMKKEAKIRYAYAKAIDSACLDKFTRDTVLPIINDVHKKIQEAHRKPDFSTVYRWFKRFNEGGKDIRALVTRNGRKGNRKNRYQRQFYQLIDQAINTIFLSEERGTVQDTVDHATDLVRRENENLPPSMHHPLPTISIVKKLLKQVPEYDKVLARRGKAAADREYRTVLGRVGAEKPLDRVEIDHTVLDVMLLDDDMFPLGRPTLTVCIDVMSRSILGIYIGFEPPSYLTVAQCLKHAFLPKVDLHEKYPSVKNEWIQHGVMVTLVVDNGLEFHSHNLESLCYPFGITIQYTPRKKPWFKPVVERFIGSFNRGVCHGVPGTTFEGILEREDYNAAEKAVLTLSTFREIVNIWIVDYYHQRQHKILKDTPTNVWQKNIHDYDIPLPNDVNDLDYLVGATEDRQVSHIGVQLNSLRYNSEELNEIRIGVGPAFDAKIRYNQADLGYIYVIHPLTDSPLRVPALDLEYAEGLSEWQHKVCKRYALENMGRTNIEALAEAKETIRELIADDLSDKRVKTRKRAHRFMSSADQEKPVTSISKQSNVNVKQPTKPVQAENQMSFNFEAVNDADNTIQVVKLKKHLDPKG